MQRIIERKLKIKFKNNYKVKKAFITHTAQTTTVNLFYNNYTLYIQYQTISNPNKKCIPLFQRITLNQILQKEVTAYGQNLCGVNNKPYNDETNNSIDWA